MIGRDALRVALRTALVALLAYSCGVYITGFFHVASAGMGGLWAVMSGVVALQETRARPGRRAWRQQVLGPFIGAIVSAAYLSVLPFSAIGMAACIFATVLICHVSRILDHLLPAALAVAVVMVFSSLHPTLHPLLNAALRFSEACIGATIAGLAMLVWPELPPKPLLPRTR